MLRSDPGHYVRQAAVAGESDSVAGKLREPASNRILNYTQQDAKAIIDRRSADENAAFMKLAQRLIDQQEAALNTPAAIRASIPEQGRLLTFKRAVVVDTWADLRIRLGAQAAQAADWSNRLAILLAVLAALGALTWAGRRVVRSTNPS